MPKTRENNVVRKDLVVIIHKDLRDFVLKNTEKAGNKNESEYVNAVLRRLKAGVEK